MMIHMLHLGAVSGSSKNRAPVQLYTAHCTTSSGPTPTPLSPAVRRPRPPALIVRVILRLEQQHVLLTAAGD